MQTEPELKAKPALSEATKREMTFKERLEQLLADDGKFKFGKQWYTIADPDLPIEAGCSFLIDELREMAKSARAARKV